VRDEWSAQAMERGAALSCYAVLFGQTGAECLQLATKGRAWARLGRGGVVVL